MRCEGYGRSEPALIAHAAPARYAPCMTNKTPREEEIQKEQEAKDAEKERLEQEEERRLR